MNLFATLINKLYLPEGYTEAQRDFALAGDPDQVAQAIATYKDLVNRNQFSGDERNIDWWRKQGWEKFKNTIDNKAGQKTKTQEKRSKSVGDAITLEETGDWLIIVPLDKDASCYHGKNTDWCTAKPFASHFEQYFYRDNVSLIYFLQITTGKRWACAVYDDRNQQEWFDSNDNSIDVQQFTQQTGIDKPNLYIHKVQEQHVRIPVTSVRQHYKDLKASVVARLENLSSPDENLENDLWIVKDPNLMLKYCNGLKRRWVKFEKYLMSGVTETYEDAVEYANDVIGSRWPEYEQVLFKAIGKTDTTNWLLYYLNYVLSGNRWPELEQACTEILTSTSDKQLFNRYARAILHYKIDCSEGQIGELMPLLTSRLNPAYAESYASVIYEQGLDDVDVETAIEIIPFGDLKQVRAALAITGTDEKAISLIKSRFERYFNIDMLQEVVSSAIFLIECTKSVKWSELEHALINLLQTNSSPTLARKTIVSYIIAARPTSWPELFDSSAPTIKKELFHIISRLVWSCAEKAFRLQILEDYFATHDLEEVFGSDNYVDFKLMYQTRVIDYINARTT